MVADERHPDPRVRCEFAGEAGAGPPPAEPLEPPHPGRAGDDHRDVPVAGELLGVGRDRRGGIAVAGEEPERDVDPERRPARRQAFVVGRVALEVDGVGDARADRLRVLEGVHGLPVEVLHDQHRDRTPARAVIERLQPHVELGVLAQVLAVHPDEDPHHHGDEHHHRPRAVRELRDRDHDRDHRGGDRAETVDRETVAPAGFAQAEVALGHAGLRQGERGEHADRVQRDQLVDVGPEHDHERGRGDRETDDAVGEHQPLSRAW